MKTFLKAFAYMIFSVVFDNLFEGTSDIRIIIVLFELATLIVIYKKNKEQPKEKREYKYIYGMWGIIVATLTYFYWF